jgi:prepilin signal peptidase PulO-like enzyme (type II secretory pathway)
MASHTSIRSKSIASSGAESPVVASFQAWATDFSTDQWQVHLRLLNSRNEWIYFGSGWMEALAGAAGGWGIMKSAQVLCRRRLRRECIGSGDALLMLSLGAFLGLKLLPWGVGIAGVMGFIDAKLCGREKVPFGPFLTCGCMLASVLTQYT